MIIPSLKIQSKWTSYIDLEDLSAVDLHVVRSYHGTQGPTLQCTVTWCFSPASCRWFEFTNTSKWVGGWGTREHIQLARKLEVGKSLGRCSGTQRDRQGLIWSGISSQGKWCKVIRSEVGVCRHNESIFSSSSQDGRLTVADAAKLTPQSHPGDRQWPPSIS